MSDDELYNSFSEDEESDDEPSLFDRIKNTVSDQFSEWVDSLKDDFMNDIVKCGINAKSCIIPVLVIGVGCFCYMTSFCICYVTDLQRQKYERTKYGQYTYI